MNQVDRIVYHKNFYADSDCLILAIKSDLEDTAVFAVFKYIAYTCLTLSYTLSYIVKYKELRNPKNFKFSDLLKICTVLFGEPRIRGSHHIFKTPWKGDPRINIRKDGKNAAKPYQVKLVLKAIEKLEAANER